MFRNASNVVVTGGNFTSIDNSGNCDAVSTTLWQHTAPAAIFDSAERYASGKCHPGTRKRIIKRITDWITDSDSTQHVLWLYGPAGSGKSALAHSICELLRHSYPEGYGGSFFFARGPTDRGKAITLFPTLAYQLSIQFPALRSEINDVLSRDPSIPTKSLDIQLQSLLVHPIQKCSSWPSHPPIMVIDGLDECEEDDAFDTQRNIIDLISRSVLENHNVPLRFMISSRPEYWIRDAFEASPLPRITLPLSLRDDADADNDIQMYLTENFDKIRLENKRLMGSVETPWPPTHIVKRFVEEASGQYIYASTVLKFVGKSSRFNNPQEQLRIITSPGPHRASAFSELDRLYATILSAYPRREILKRFLGGLLTNANSTTLEVILDIDPSECTLILDALSSLINITEPNALSEDALLLVPIFGSLGAGERQISFCHLTFREFLEDKTRSGPFYVDVADTQDEISRAFFRKIHENLDNNYDVEPRISFQVELTTYRRLMSDLIFYSVPYCPVDTLVPLISGLNQRLGGFARSGKMCYPACFVQDMEWVDTMLSETEESYKDLTRGTDTNILFAAIAELRKTVSSARKRGIQILSLSSDFRMTPTLVYIDMFGTGYGVPLKKLFQIPGSSVDDILVSLRQYRHIIKMYELVYQEWFIYLVDLNQNSEKDISKGWLAQTEWVNQRIALTYECLKSMMRNVDNDWEHSTDGVVNIGQLVVDSTAWTNLLPLRLNPWETAYSVILPALCWFNRQLKNIQTLRLMEDYNKDLPQRMIATMKEIFAHCFLPTFTTASFRDLCISMKPGAHPGRSIKITVQPLSSALDYKRIFWEEETIYSPPEIHLSDSIQRFHEELFSSLDHPAASSNHSVISCSGWYPHLAAFLLNVLVKYQYCRMNKTFLGEGHDGIIEDCFAYILQCLPYAHTTRENLDAFRALSYLWPQVPPWILPFGFCSLAVEFLAKYESSTLSFEELNLFKRWLSDLRAHEVPKMPRR